METTINTKRGIYMLTERTYTAGLYLRLSKDDDGRSESVSIGTQDRICQGVFLQKLQII